MEEDKLIRLSRASFQIIDEESAKDKYHDYYLGEIVE